MGSISIAWNSTITGSVPGSSSSPCLGLATVSLNSRRRSGQFHRVVMVMTVLDVDRQAINAFVIKCLLIARTGSGGTVKTSPPMDGGSINKKLAAPSKRKDACNPRPHFAIRVIVNPLLASQLRRALDALDSWEVS